jgi:hypothetical protein
MIIRDQRATVGGVERTNATSTYTPTDQDEVIILRLWREKDEPDGEDIWRASVRYERTGVLKSFHDIEKALERVASLTRSIVQVESR